MSSKIWYILALGLFLRVLLPASAYVYTDDSTIFYGGDSVQYIVSAGELVTHHRFYSDGSERARAWNWPIAPAPEILRTPGYPLMLAASLLTGHFILATIALQILLSCLTIYLVYRIADLLFEDERISLGAAALYAIEPLALLFSSLISTETLFTAVFMIGVYYLVKYLKRQSLTELLLSASALAASVYVRPVGYFLPFLIALGLAVRALVSTQKNKFRLLAHLIAFLVVSFTLTGLWRIRNKMVMGFSGFSSVFSEDIYCNTAASVLAAERNLPDREMQDRMGCYDLRVYLRHHPEQRNQPVAQLFEHERSDALRILFRNPLTFSRIYLAGVIRGVFDPGSTEFVRFYDLYPKQNDLLETAVDDGPRGALKALLLDQSLAWSTIALLALQLLYLSSAGIAAFKESRWEPAILIISVIMGYYLVLPGGASDWGRYRHPAMPIICILASCSLLRSRARAESSAYSERVAAGLLVPDVRISNQAPGAGSSEVLAHESIRALRRG